VATPMRHTVVWTLFGLKGRISRRVYWLSLALIVSVQSVVLAQLVGGPEASFNRLAATAWPPMLAASLYCTFALSVKRLHDIGYAGFLALAIFIPVVNLAFSIWVGLIPGVPAANQFGNRIDTPPS
jgi:uncharacterized membrane protein YhaH (DUF805 family)